MAQSIKPHPGATLVAQGGITPYSWSATGLPAGLSLSVTGILGGTPTNTGNFSVTVTAKDSSAPPQTIAKTFSLTIASSLTIATGASPDGVITQPYPGATLLAQGGTTPYSWSATGLPAGLSLSAAGVLTGTATSSGTYSIVITVKDTSTPQQTASKTFPLTIASGLTINTAALPSGVANLVYLGATLQAQGGTPPYTWSATGLPAGMSLSPSGVLSGTATSAGAFSLVVTVRDSSSPQQTASKSIALTVASGLTIASAVLPGGIANQIYPPSASLQAQGGNPPYSWSATGLPPGMNLSLDGVLGGTATSAGAFSVTVTVADSSTPQQTTSKTLSLTIASGLTITTAALPSGGLNQTYQTTTLQAQGGATPYNWSATGLPPGLSLSSGGVLTGIPSSQGTFSLTVNVTDSATPQQTASKTFGVTIASDPAITTVTLPDGFVTQPYPALTLQALGGATPYSWSATGLPAGLSLSAGGVLDGTPSALGSYSVTITLRDSSTPPRTASRTYPVSINLIPAPLFTVSIGAQPTKITDQPAATLHLDQPYPLPLIARLTLTFAPNASSVPSGSYSSAALQFASGGKNTSVTVPPNNTSIPLPNIQVGDVAGTVTVALSSVTISGTDQALPISGPIPAGTITVPRLAPEFSGAVRFVNVTASGFTLEVVASSTPRDLTGATVNFMAASGATLSGTTFTVPLSDAAKAWFESPAGQAAGGAFDLKIPFPFSGDTKAIGSASVTLTNSIGTSLTVSGMM